MRAYVSQSHLEGTLSIVANHINISEPPEGEPTLLTFGEVTTIFHEFGHALHGMFSNVTYPSFAGTRVPRDFVEYPSQVNEMWSTWPEVLQNYARHYDTGEPMPAELLAKVLEAEQFNQGYATADFLASSLTDPPLHHPSPDETPSPDEPMQFSADPLASAGPDLAALPARHPLTCFSHLPRRSPPGLSSYI